jgi:peptidoglycan/LPS O-acetylase OafA/YrhL
LAALEVFLGHLRTLVFEGYGTSPSGFIRNSFYFLTGFSHQAVIIFFVLSGYFITDTIFRSRDKGRFSMTGYSIDRLTRLWIVLIPGLLLTWALDSAGLHFYGANPAYTGTIQYLGNVNVASHLNFGNFIGSIFFLQSIVVESFGSNTPLWSLTNEFWYYVLFPLVLLVFWKQRFWLKAILVVTIIIIVLFIGWEISLYFFIWLMGSAIAWVKRNFPAPTVLMRSGILFFGVTALIICLFKIRTGVSMAISFDFLTGIITAIVCYGSLYADGIRAIPKKIISFLSGFSYSLYVIHLPLCIFLSSAILGVRQIWGFKGILVYLLLAMLVIGITILFWYCFESRYLELRARVRNRLFPAINSNS